MKEYEERKKAMNHREKKGEQSEKSVEHTPALNSLEQDSLRKEKETKNHTIGGF